MFFSNFSLGCFIVFEYMFASVLGNDSHKRLLLNDPDVAGQINQMEKNLQSLTHQVSQLTSNLNDVKSELAVQKLKSAGAGSTYIRWGRKSCPGSDIQLVYSGFTAGQNLNEYSNRYGGPSDFLCLPNNPELSNLTTAGDSHLFGTEYEEATLRADAIDEDIPCAVCKSVNTHVSIMIPGRETCYQGWKKEYNGLLASDHYAYSASSYICVDKQPEYVSGGQENKDGRRLYFTSTRCGSLSCPPYKNNQAVNCVVCSQ